MKNKEFVSRVVNGLKALQKDTHISKRYILSIGKAKSKFLMSQKLDQLSLFKEDAIISTIKCFRLKKDNLVTCDIVEFKRCKSLMKSTMKLPETLFGKTGAGILSITTIDGEKDFTYATPNAIINKGKRKYGNRVNQNFYYIRDGYLYIPNSEIELVDITLFALDGQEVEDASECSECSSCQSALDNEFVCPDRFIDLVLRETLQEVASIYRTSVADENPNWDENQKTQTVK